MPDQNYQKATFAGGCFWCMEPPFAQLPGVKDIQVGYTGGTVENPTYEQVCSGKTGHAEAVQITFDPQSTSYEQLLEVFWRNIDPTAQNRQFADRGSQYRTAIFYHTGQQKEAAQRSKKELQDSGAFTEPIATQISPADTFYPAEDYHQQYYKKHPGRYQMYKIGSGREGYLKEKWGR